MDRVGRCHGIALQQVFVSNGTRWLDTADAAQFLGRRSTRRWPVMVAFREILETVPVRGSRGGVGVQPLALASGLSLYFSARLLPSASRPALTHNGRIRNGPRICRDHGAIPGRALREGVRPNDQRSRTLSSEVDALF